MARYTIHQFTFTFKSYGIYSVQFATARRGDYYTALVDYMPLIDATKNSDEPTGAALRELAQYVRNHGTHYHANGDRFED